MKDTGNIKKTAITVLAAMTLMSVVFLSGCRQYDDKLDIVYFFKTEPEKAVVDFLYCLDNDDVLYIYDNFLPNKDKNNISKERFLVEFEHVIEDLDTIEVKNTHYLGFEDEMSKVVAEFKATYKDGKVKDYKKYIYLVEENNSWKIVFEKTFI